jgi:cysteinyl-tRNA synthetase
MARGRGRLSSLQLLPRECSHVVQWAAAELQENARSQLDIYQEFVSKLEQIQREQRATEAIKSLVLTIVRTKKDSLDAKAVMALSSAVHKAAQAQSVSTDRRKKVEANFKAQADKVLDAAAGQLEASGKPDGQEVLRKIREDIYGIFER